MFELIADGLDDLKEDIRMTMGGIASVRDDMSALDARLGSQEGKIHSAWHAIRRVEDRLNDQPEEQAKNIERHERGCHARKYVQGKLSRVDSSDKIPVIVTPEPTGQHVLPQVDSVSPTMDTTKIAGIVVPKWIVYIGVTIGVAIAASGYVLHAVGILGSG
jgi:hypothetical protein